MKRCSTCQRVYQDEMSFCLEDGAALMSISEVGPDQSATLQIPAPRLTNQPPTEAYAAEAAPSAQPAPPQIAHQRYAQDSATAPQRKSGALPWIMGAIILGLAAVIVGLLMMRGQDDSQTAKDSANLSANTATPMPDAAPTISQMENPAITPPPTEQKQGETPTGISERPSPTPKPTQNPKSTPERGSAEEPPPPPPPTPTPATRPRAPISGGVLNGKAISLPKPAYPPVARAARATGTVTVQVTVDESGRVVSARAVSGHPLLQQAAVQAANGARFAPTLLSGQAVKVTGVITYNFVAQ